MSAAERVLATVFRDDEGKGQNWFALGLVNYASLPELESVTSTHMDTSEHKGTQRDIMNKNTYKRESELKPTRSIETIPQSRTINYSTSIFSASIFSTSIFSNRCSYFSMASLDTDPPMLKTPE